MAAEARRAGVPGGSVSWRAAAERLAEHQRCEGAEKDAFHEGLLFRIIHPGARAPEG